MQATVNSVGPYRFSRVDRGAAADQAFANSTGSGSPQKRLQRNDSYRFGFRAPNRFMNIPTVGTDVHTVSAFSRMNASGFRSVLSDGQHTHAPLSQATNMSRTERSNVASNICEKRSLDVMPYRSVIASTKCVTLRCDTITPLGAPALPEVKRR